MLIDADDQIDSSFVEKALDILKNFKTIGAVSSWAVCFGYEDFIWYPQGGTIKDFVYSTTCPSCALVRRETWIDTGGFDESFLIGYEDWNFWIDVTKRGWVIFIIQELLYFYMQKENSRVKVTFSKHDEIYKIISEKHPDIFLLLH